MSNTEQKFDLWCIVELFGHSKIAGKCTEQNVAGTNMLRVDVPETDGNPAFTKLYNHGAIYAINPVTQEIATHYASQLTVKPMESWDIKKFQEKQLQLKMSESENDGEDEFGFYT